MNPYRLSTRGGASKEENRTPSELHHGTGNALEQAGAIAPHTRSAATVKLCLHGRE
jgi:hypothetical protein